MANRTTNIRIHFFVRIYPCLSCERISSREHFISWLWLTNRAVKRDSWCCTAIECVAQLIDGCFLRHNTYLMLRFEWPILYSLYYILSLSTVISTFMQINAHMSNTKRTKYKRLSTHESLWNEDNEAAKCQENCLRFIFDDACSLDSAFTVLIIGTSAYGGCCLLHHFTRVRQSQSICIDMIKWH